MFEVATIDVCGGVVELGDGAGHGASQAGTDDERYHFNDSKDNSHKQQTKFDGLRKVTEGCKQTLIDFRYSSLHPDGCRLKFVAGVPVDYRDGRAEGDLRIYSRRRRWHSPCGIGGPECFLAGVQ